jgi:two-component system sensor histidine kinase KdpD
VQAASSPQTPTSTGGGTPGGYALAIVGAALAVVVALGLQRWLGLGDLSLVFMLAVLVVASRTSTGPAVLTAILCFLAYNFFFIEPRYTFYITARHGVATVVLFLAAALLAGRLAAQLSMRVHALGIANHHAVARQELAAALATAASEKDVAGIARAAFRRSLDAEAWIRLGERGPHDAGIGTPPPSVLRRVDATDGPARLAESVEEFGWWFLPLQAPDGPLGAIGLKLPPQRLPLDHDQRQLARAMSDDIAQALLRTRLVADLQAERVANESERLRGLLLSSVSHDLRTPLAAIIGAASSLDNYADAMGAADRHALLDTVRVEGERLDRYIQNLLDMARLGHGAPALERDWIGVDELIGSATTRMRRYQPDVRFTVAIAPGLPPLRVHPALLEQALLNVIENAARYSPPGEAILLTAQRAGGDRLCIEVSDRGPGIPEASRQRIFEMFYSVAHGDGAQGTGLGLAICRGIVEAHGGTVEALPGIAGQGTTLRLLLPVDQAGREMGA